VSMKITESLAHRRRTKTSGGVAWPCWNLLRRGARCVLNSTTELGRWCDETCPTPLIPFYCEDLINIRLGLIIDNTTTKRASNPFDAGATIGDLPLWLGTWIMYRVMRFPDYQLWVAVRMTTRWVLDDAVEARWICAIPWRGVRDRTVNLL